MPKVRILSGNEAGRIKDLSTSEAQAATASGFAELIVEPKPRPAPPAAEAHKAKAPKAK